MLFRTRGPALALALLPFFVSPESRAQTAAATASTPPLANRHAELPSAPSPQTSSSQQNQGKPQDTGAPSLADLGLRPDQTKADLDAQRRLDRRSHDLKVHQTLGMITLLPIAAACLTSGLAPPDPKSGSNDVGRDIHVALGGASVALYGGTAWYAIKAPRIPGQGPTKGGIKLHKYLVAIHAPGMVLTPVLGAMAYNQTANGQKVTGIASAHQAVALVTAGAYVASIVAVSWPIRLPGHHSSAATQGAASSEAGAH